MTCTVCPGSGYLLHSHRGKWEWWPCPACGGAGARIVYGPPTFDDFRTKEDHHGTR